MSVQNQKRPPFKKRNRNPNPNPNPIPKGNALNGAGLPHPVQQQHFKRNNHGTTAGGQRKRRAEEEEGSLYVESKRIRMNSEGQRQQQPALTAESIFARLTTSTVVDLVMANLRRMPDALPASLADQHQPVLPSAADVHFRSFNIAHLMAAEMKSTGLDEEKPAEVEAKSATSADPSQNGGPPHGGEGEGKGDGVGGSLPPLQALRSEKALFAADRLVGKKVEQETSGKIALLTKRLCKRHGDPKIDGIKRQLQFGICDSNDQLRESQIRLALESVTGKTCEEAESFVLNEHLAYRTAPADRRQEALERYEERIAAVLVEALRRSEAGNFRSLLHLVPLLTGNLLEAVQKAAVRESEAVEVIGAVKEVFLKRAKFRRECFRLLRSYSQEEKEMEGKEEVRRVASEVVKSLGCYPEVKDLL